MVLEKFLDYLGEKSKDYPFLEDYQILEVKEDPIGEAVYMGRGGFEREIIRSYEADDEIDIVCNLLSKNIEKLLKQGDIDVRKFKPETLGKLLKSFFKNKSEELEHSEVTRVDKAGAIPHFKLEEKVTLEP